VENTKKAVVFSTVSDYKCDVEFMDHGPIPPCVEQVTRFLTMEGRWVGCYCESHYHYMMEPPQTHPNRIIEISEDEYLVKSVIEE
jgi:hypothetical protein